MSSPGQRRGKCVHVMANFDTHSHCARCRDKGKGKEPCVSDPQTTNCQICNSLTSDQLQQLATPSYKLKKEKREAKLTEPAPSQDSEQLVDPSNVSVIGVIDAQGSVKSPAVAPPPDKKPKKDNKKEKSPSTKVSKHSIDEKFAEMDSKWSERFSRLDALIMAKSFEPTFSSKVKVTPTHSPPHDIENMAEPFIRPSTSKLTGTGFSAEKHQPTSQAVTSQHTSTTKLTGSGFSATKHQPTSQARSHRPTSTAGFTGKGSSAIVHQPTSQTKVNRPTPATDPSTDPHSAREGDINQPYSDRPSATDRPLSSEPAALLFTGLDVIASPVCHLRPVACRITHHWIYILKKGSYLRTRISLYRTRTNQCQKSRIIGILCRVSAPSWAGCTSQNWTIQLPRQMITLSQDPRL